MNHLRMSVVVCIVLTIFIEVTEQANQLPEDLRQSNWVASGEHAVGDITFGNAIMIGYPISIMGTEVKAYTCISAKPSDGIYVFRSDGQIFNPLTWASMRVHLCMRLKKITNNIYSFYILADAVNADERYMTLTDDTIPSDACELCQATSPPADAEYSLLTRVGSTDQVPSNHVFMNCPCGTTSEECGPVAPPEPKRKICHHHREM